MTTDANMDKKENEIEDKEGQHKKIKYPRAVPFIISNEFCERFNYYGLRTILVIYLTRQLDYSKDTATVIYHIFTMLAYFMCIFGAILSDSWLGKFKTILYLSIVYVIGCLLVVLGAIPPLHLPAIEMTILGLVLVAIGSGGIKPCVSAFGGDQFKLPEQAKQFAGFFSFFYFSINAGSLISSTITPILREDVHCFNENNCFSLAFGVPVILMTIAIIVFIAGKTLYVIKPPEGNMLARVTKAIGNAITTRCREKQINPRPHWLDYAEGKYGRKLVEEIKVLLRVLLLYIPMPIFWALFDQQGSRWTFQATRMDGTLGSIEIKPDQMLVINPLLVLILIPLCDVAVYPVLSKIGIRRPLQKLTVGGVLAGVSFVLSGVVEMQLEKTYPVLPSAGYSQLRIYNGVPGCEYTIMTNIPDHIKFNIKPINHVGNNYVPFKEDMEYVFSASSTNSEAKNCPPLREKSLGLKDGVATSHYLFAYENELHSYMYEEHVDKPEKGSPLMRVFTNFNKPKTITFRDDLRDGKVQYDESSTHKNITEILSSTYKIYVDDNEVTKVELRQGAVYVILISEKTDGGYESGVVVIAEPNSLSMMWLIPQFVIMSLGEVMFSITGLEFSYEQAPESMKSVLQAFWQLGVGFGNLIVVIVAEAKIFESQANEFFLFAGLMFLDMLLFMLLAYLYRPYNPQLSDESSSPKNSDAKQQTIRDTSE